MNDNWLTLMEYSGKYKVSISTLRRRIKSEEIGYQLSDGKYFLLDEALPTQSAASGSENAIAPPTRVVAAPQSQEPSVQSHHRCQTSELLLQEVKKAYAMVLQEKEEQILQLREEVSDLKTLVRVLENEVTRLKNKTSAPTLNSTTYDLGLELESF